MGDMQRVRINQPHIPVDARAGVEAGVGEPRMIYAHGHDIVRPRAFHIRGEVTGEAGEAKGPGADELAVDPDLRVVIHAVEFDGHVPAGLRRIKLEVFAIPGDAAGGEAVAAAVLRAERPLDAPIVRDAERPPLGVGKHGHHGGGEVAPAEEPMGVKILRDAGRGGREAGGQEGAEQHQGERRRRIKNFHNGLGAT